VEALEAVQAKDEGSSRESSGMAARRGGAKSVSGHVGSVSRVTAPSGARAVTRLGIAPGSG
jgi:hypothetical protein